MKRTLCRVAAGLAILLAGCTSLPEHAPTPFDVGPPAPYPGGCQEEDRARGVDC